MAETFIRTLTRCNRYVFLPALFLCLFTPCIPNQSPLTADVYQYVDKGGVIHLTNVLMNGNFKVLIKEGPVHFALGSDNTQYDPVILMTADKYGVDYALVKAVIKTESNFNHKAVSRKGARGLMQLMPQTASILGVNDCFRPEDNIDGGIRHLGYLISVYNGDLTLALAAYNAGQDAVTRYRGIPPYAETRAYIRRVIDNYNHYRQESMATMYTAK